MLRPIHLADNSRECCSLLSPLQMMFDRAENEKEESDVAYFNALMYAGEVVFEINSCGVGSGGTD